MIQANELRIGNFVMLIFNDKKFERVVGLLEFENCIGAPQEFEGIPLTEEWVLNFGLTRNEYHTHELIYFLDENCLVGIGMHNDAWYFVEFETEAQGQKFEFPANLALIVFKDNPIQFVHQFQNLYFALTGKELQFKTHDGN
jgi:hypothetical protein